MHDPLPVLFFFEEKNKKDKENYVETPLKKESKTYDLNLSSYNYSSGRKDGSTLNSNLKIENWT